MQDISVLKEKFEKIYAKRCFGNEDISQCPLGDKCECKKAAEIKAYMYSIIGSLYYKYSIWDFNGYSGEYDQIVEKDNLSQDYNIYVFHGTDGDDSDNSGKEALTVSMPFLSFEICSG